MHFFPQKKLPLMVYYGNLMVCLWECHYLLQKNNLGISVQVEKRKIISEIILLSVQKIDESFWQCSVESKAYLII